METKLLTHLSLPGTALNLLLILTKKVQI